MIEIIISFTSKYFFAKLDFLSDDWALGCMIMIIITWNNLESRMINCLGKKLEICLLIWGAKAALGIGLLVC